MTHSQSSTHPAGPDDLHLRPVAQTTRRSQVAGLISAVALICAGIIWYVNRGTPAVHGGNDWNARLACAACGHEFDAHLTLTFPRVAETCSKCGQKAAWEMKYCSMCKHTFLPPLVGDPPRPQIMPKCPKCQDNKNVGAYVPGLEAEGLEGSS